MRRRRRPSNRYELLTCAWKGHVFVGTDARQLTDKDQLIAREADGQRWHRCLRCDDWVQFAVPLNPTRETPQARHEIEVPLRGPLLRDRYVLRLIAVDRAIHVIVLSALAIVLFTFAGHDQSLHRYYINIMNDLSGGDPGGSKAKGILGYLGRAFKYTPADLIKLGVVISAYAVLEAVEMVGLWLNKRWAEYLTFVATTALVPYEVYELTLSISAFKIVTLVINLAVVIYLLLAKRLFGARGGHQAEMERRQGLSGWEAIEKATPGVPAA